MKRIIFILAALLLLSCESEVKPYVSLEGKLNQTDVDTLQIQGKDFIRKVPVQANGSFKDTLTIEKGIFAISNGQDRMTLFLENGYDLDLSFKGEKLADGAAFKGRGSVTNNYIENVRLFYESAYANPKTYFSLENEAYESKLKEAKELLQQYKSAGPADSLVIAMADRNEQMFFGYIEANYESMHAMSKEFAKGNASPQFSDYENHSGGTNSLSDFKGSYVYIDVWATWCAPCKAEIPFLKAIEEEYHDKNITFISLSVDKEGAYETWKKMVSEENLGGVQLLADKDFESDFIKKYRINAIPRFILIDPDGNIVDADAPRPSNPELKELFNSLDI